PARAGGPAREPAGERAGPGGRRRPPLARTRPHHHARPAGRPRGSDVPRTAPRPGARRLRSLLGPVRRTGRARAVRGRIDRKGAAGLLPATGWGLADTGPRAAPEPGLLGAGLPRRDRPRRVAGPGGDARPARALRRAPGAGPRRTGTQAL